MRTPRVRPLVALLAIALLFTFAPSPAHARWPAGQTQSLALTPAARGTDLIDACADGAGGAYLAWGLSYPPYGSYLQHIDAFGIERFPGVTWTPDTTVGTPLHLAPDGADGLAALTKLYPASGGVTLALTRLSSGGVRAWTAPFWNGMWNGDVDWTRIANDPAGNGVLVAWIDGALSPYVLHTQRFDRSGAPAWGAAGVVAFAGANVHLHGLAPDGSGGCWVAMRCDSTPGQLRVQHVSSNGTAAWPGSGVKVEDNASAWQLADDAAGGLYVSFTPDFGNARVQRVRADGSLALGTHGLVPGWPVYSSVQSPSLGAAANGHVFVAWQASESGYHGARVQLMDSSGTWLWPGAVLAGKAPASGLGTRVYANSDGSATITVQPAMQVSGATSGAQRFTTGGALLWPDPPPTLIVTQSPDQGLYDYDPLYSVPTGDGGVMYFTTLADSGTGFDPTAYRVRAQHLDAYGRRGDTSPRITSVLDVPGDTGGAIEVRWAASSLEGDASMATTGYDVLRGQPNGSFVVVGHRDATGASTYFAQVPTLADSTSPASPRTVVRVRSTDAAARTWTSPADSGASYPNSPPLAVDGAGSRTLSLAPPAPSPASGRTGLRFSLPADGRVRLALFDAGGRLLRDVATGQRPRGEQSVTLELVDGAGRPLAAGLYFIRLAAAGGTLTRRLLVLP